MLRALALIAVTLGGCGRLRFEPLDDAGAGITDAADAADAAPARIVYAASVLGELYTIDPATLVETFVRKICTNITESLDDLAVDQAGQLMMTSRAPAIHLVNADGTCTTSPTPVNLIFATAWLPASPTVAEYYIAARNGNLYRADVGGTMILVGPTGLVPAGDLTWTGAEALMSTDMPYGLARVDKETAVGMAIAPVNDELRGLAWIDGMLLAFTVGGLALEVDAMTGQYLRMRTTTIGWTGAAVTF